MFAGLMGLEYLVDNGRPQHHRCEAMEGGKAVASAGCSGRKRLHRRPGYMRGESPRLQSSGVGEEGRTACLRSGASGVPGGEGEGDANGTPARALREGLVPRHGHAGFLSPVSPPLPPLGCGVAGRGPSSRSASLTLQPCPAESSLSPPRGAFNSSFSFIQESLNSSLRTDAEKPTIESSEPLREPRGLTSRSGPPPSGPFTPEPTSPGYLSIKTPVFSKSKPTSPCAGQPVPKLSAPTQSEPAPAPAGQSELGGELSLGGRFWQERQWGAREVTSDLPDCCDSSSFSLDTEAASTVSVDSDAASASSVTSGYESATPASDQGWDALVKTYEGVLQDCLQNNRTNTKIDSMMVKLQRLQQKAIVDDDYDTAERFGQQLEQLLRQRGSLRLGLPSRQPSVSLFLQRLYRATHSALQNTPHRDRVDPEEERSDSQAPLHRRDRLIHEKRLVEVELAELQRRLEEVQERSRSLEQQLEEEQEVETEELEASVLRGCSAAQLRGLSRALRDLTTSEHRKHISVCPSPSMIRLQEQEQMLSLSIKEVTAKVVMSQRLGGSLRRKVSETETQLMALHEAKLAAISGKDFGGAKELKAEMRAAQEERARLEGLARRLHSLSSGNGQELTRMKETRLQVKHELEERETRHESSLKENTTKYIELLEDRLHSCGCPPLERVCAADLEACHLFLHGLQLRTPSGAQDLEDTPPPAPCHAPPPRTKDEEDCAMLTALGGRWCPEANLQNSEFAKKLEEFLFCMEENHTEEERGEAEAADLTVRCELISDRLLTLEDELQTALVNRDQARTQSLEKEVGEVKATLQAMLTQLEDEEEEEEEEQENGVEEEEGEEEEDQYFSDSWDI